MLSSTSPTTITFIQYLLLTTDIRVFVLNKVSQVTLPLWDPWDWLLDFCYWLHNNYNSTLQILVYTNNKPQDLSDGNNKICLNWGLCKPGLLFNWQLGKCLIVDLEIHISFSYFLFPDISLISSCLVKHYLLKVHSS